MTTILAVSNQKGGVGKTTTAVNLADIYSGTSKVCLIDLTSEAQASDHLGLRQDEDPPMLRLLTDKKPGALKDYVVETPFGFDLVPSGLDLAEAEAKLVLQPEGIRRLRNVLRQPAARMAHDYDIILIDCPPSLTMLTLSAWIAAHHILVPLLYEAAPLDGFARLLKKVEEVKEFQNPEVTVAAVWSNKSDERAALTAQVGAELRAQVPDMVLSEYVRSSRPLARAYDLKKPVQHVDPNSNGYQDMLKLASAIATRLTL